MLMQSYDMLFDKHVAVQSSPSYRYCWPVLVSSKQDSGRAGPEKGVLYKHKCRVFLVCSYRAIKCYLASMWLCITHLAIGSVDQLRWAANSTLAEQDLWRVCCINTKVGFIWYAPHRAIICYLLNKQLCRAHLAIGSLDQLQWAANRALAEQDLRRVCCINTKVGFMICSSRAIICFLLNM